MNRDVKLSTFGNQLMMLYSRVNLSQGEFATSVGISPSALRRWESDTSCPKAESLKRAIETLLSKGAFSQGEEQVEAMRLWELANKRGLKVPFDEAWFRGLMQDPASVGTGVSLAYHPRSENEKPLSVPTYHPLGIDIVQVRGEQPQDLPMRASVGTASLALPPAKTRGKRKRLLFLLVALVILTIIASAGALFFYARAHSTDQTYPGYLSGHGTFVFFDPLSQASGSQWGSYDTNSDGGTCQFTKGAYHVSQPESFHVTLCPAHGIFSNFAFEVLLTITGGDCGGLLIRDSYYFRLCEDSGYKVYKYVSNNATDGKTLFHSKRSAFHTGLGHENKIAVVASGNIMTLYINEQQIDQVQVSSFTAGHVSLSVTALSSGTDVAYSNARLWTLSGGSAK